MQQFPLSLTVPQNGCGCDNFIMISPKHVNVMDNDDDCGVNGGGGYVDNIMMMMLKTKKKRKGE